MFLYDFSFISIEGHNVSLSDFKNKVVIIVNTASKCGFTPQYEGLETIYKDFKDKGVVIIGFPCDQFANQEPGSNEEIHEFCKLRFGVTFPLSQKVNVRGDGADPLFKYITSIAKFNGVPKGLKNKPFELMIKAMYGKDFKDNSIKWNFTKFLFDKNGNFVERFEPVVEPKDMIPSIEKLLQQ